MKKFDSTKAKQHHSLVLEGALVGIIAGLTAVLYRFCLTYTEKYLYQILSVIQGNPWKTALWFVVLIILGVIVTKITKWEPMAGGSGIPQVCGEYKGLMNPVYWRVLLAKFTGGTLSIFSGLSLGREGPSIQLGAMAAKGVAKVKHVNKSQELKLLCCGAGAGLAAAFNAPLAGMLFVVEEIYHAVDGTLLAAGLVSTVCADFVSKIFFGQAAIFSYPTATLPLPYYWLLVLLGVILGLAGAGYNVVMLKVQALFSKCPKVPKEVKTALVFVLAGILGLILPQVLAGGHTMVSLLENSRPTFMMLFVLLIVKFLFSAFSFGSGVPGGIFFPLLILGSYIGAIFGDIALHFFALDETIWYQFIILSMAGLFASIVRAPLTGIVLIAEMTGSMHRLIDLVLVSIISYVVANLLGSEPIYTSLLNNMVGKKQDVGSSDDLPPNGSEGALHITRRRSL